MITSLIEMLKLPKFDHTIKYTIKFGSWDKILLVTSDRNYGDKSFISENLYFRKAYGSQFCWDHQNYNHVY